MVESNVGIGWNKIYSLAVGAVGKPAVYISNGNNLIEQQDIAAWYWLMAAIEQKYGKNTDISCDLKTAVIFSDIVFFDTKEEMYEFYSLFEHHIIDSGPIYACSFDKDGRLLTENT